MTVEPALKATLWFQVNLQKTNNNKLKQLSVAEAAPTFPPHSNLVYQRCITVLPLSYYMCLLLFKKTFSELFQNFFKTFSKLFLYFSEINAAQIGSTSISISFLKCSPSNPKFLRKKKKGKKIPKYSSFLSILLCITHRNLYCTCQCLAINSLVRFHTQVNITDLALLNYY